MLEFHANFTRRETIHIRAFPISTPLHIFGGNIKATRLPVIKAGTSRPRRVSVVRAKVAKTYRSEHRFPKKASHCCVAASVHTGLPGKTLQNRKFHCVKTSASQPVVCTDRLLFLEIFGRLSSKLPWRLKNSGGRTDHRSLLQQSSTWKF